MLEKNDLQHEKAVLVGIVTREQNEEKLEEYLDELEFLTYTAGGEVIKRFSQKMDVPNPKTFIGTGKMEELRIFVEANDISTVIFDDELSPSQQKNIQRIIECKVLDRTTLISTSLPKGRKPATPAPRWNWHSFNTCFRGLRGCGPTWNASVGVSGCVDPGKLK